jgi:hypothetical protein
MRLWKLLGVAGVAGVAATGAVLARSERQRRAYTPDDVRARLRERAAAASADVDPDLARPREAAADRRVPTSGTRLDRLRRRTGLAVGRLRGRRRG